MTLKLKILRSFTRLFKILVSLMKSLFSEKMLISNRCISGLMSNLIKKSWTVSIAPSSDFLAQNLSSFLTPKFNFTDHIQQTLCVKRHKSEKNYSALPNEVVLIECSVPRPRPTQRSLASRKCCQKLSKQ